MESRFPGRNLLIAYVCLAGCPLLALIGILDAGHNLQAPPDIAASWELKAEADPLGPALCLPAGPPVLQISQSGQYLSLNLARYHGYGKVGNNSAASADLQTDPIGACGASGTALHIEVSLPEPDAGRMAGVIKSAACGDCKALPFSATRLETPPETRH